ncbi:hypothetical protein MJH12_16935, partial [bacterium]|nr:hypothetical protein [bacterium]
MNTFIIISRSIVESEIWDKPPLYLKVWMYLLIRAQHKDFKGLKRGQLRTSVKEIQENCAWHSGYRKETPTPKKIRTILAWLRNPYGVVNGSQDELTIKGTMVGITKGTQGMLVTIDKYNAYQDLKNYGGNNGSNGGNPTEVTTEGQRLSLEGYNINKNEKNDKNGKEKNKTKKEVLPPTPQGESQFDSSSKIISINENKKFINQRADQKSVVEKRVDELKTKFGVNRVIQAYELFEMFLEIGKTRSSHKELQSIKNVCLILKKGLASLDDLKRSIENYKTSQLDKIEEG